MRVFMWMLLLLIANTATAQPEFDDPARVREQQKALAQARENSKMTEFDRLRLVNEACPKFEDEYWAYSKVYTPQMSDAEIRKQWAKTTVGRHCRHYGFKE